jgi:membrane protease YdiL (CAAX protease family)
MLVLVTLMKAPWLVLSFAILTATSFLWREMTRHGRSLAVPIVSHILADFGIVLAAWFMR